MASDEMIKSAIQQMREAIPDTIKALRDIISDENTEPHTRVRAARTLKQYLKEYQEYMEKENDRHIG